MAGDLILQTTKKALSLPDDYDVFDDQIIMFINGVFSTLNQLGVGPEDGFMLEDGQEKWEEYLNNVKLLNNVKSYMYLKVRLLFDPPATSFALDSFSRQIAEAEWRITVTVDWIRTHG